MIVLKVAMHVCIINPAQLLYAWLLSTHRAMRARLPWQVKVPPMTASEMIQLLPPELHAFTIFHSFEEPLYSREALRLGVANSTHLGPGTH